MNVLKAIFMLFILLIFLASCLPTSQAPLPPKTPTQPPTAAPTQPVPTPQDAPLLPPQAAQEAVKTLAVQLGVPADQVTITQIEEKDWPDGCLGLGRPDESCLQAIVPGYRVVLQVGDAQHEFRTNRDGSVLRAVKAEDEDLTPQAADLLVKITGLARESIQVTGLEQREWSNSCLGVQSRGEMCLAVITPGYLIRYQVDGKAYVVHSNADMSAGRLATAPLGMDVAIKVRSQAAKDLKVDLSAIRLITVEATQWPDACLGIEEAGKMCAQVVTPGYQVVVTAGSLEYTYHTNRDGSQIKLADSK